MRRTFTAWGLAIFIAVSGLTCTSAAVATHGTGVSVSFFYGRLRPYGTWVSHPRHGYVWHPRGVPHGWRPYTHGRWAWTTEHGWTWVSYYRWGWAPFHYGRWFFDAGYGWYWVPGRTWGPAWVAWRMGDGFIGWHPLPPGSRWRARVGLVFGGINIYAAYYTSRWVFVPARRFLSRRLHRVVVRPHQNYKFVRYTRPMTRYARVRGRIVNWSIPRRRIEYLTRRRVVPMQVRVFRNRRHWRSSGRSARQLRVYRPRLRPHRAADRPPRIGLTPWRSRRGVRRHPHYESRRPHGRPSKKQSAEGHWDPGPDRPGPKYGVPWRRRPGR
jgi:hypothetical protein